MQNGGNVYLCTTKVRMKPARTAAAGGRQRWRFRICERGTCVATRASPPGGNNGTSGEDCEVRRAGPPRTCIFSGYRRRLGATQLNLVRVLVSTGAPPMIRKGHKGNVLERYIPRTMAQSFGHSPVCDVSNVPVGSRCMHESDSMSTQNKGLPRLSFMLDFAMTAEPHPNTTTTW